MNICILTRTMPAHSLGGMEMHTKDLAEALVKKKNKVTVVTTKNPKREYEEVNGVKIYYLKNTKPGKYSGSWYRESAKKFEDLNRAENFDIVHSQGIGAYGFFIKNKRCKKIPVIASFHGTPFDEIKTLLNTLSLKQPISSVKAVLLIYKWGLVVDKKYKRFASVLDGAIATSNEQEKILREKYSVKKEKIYKVFNGIDIDLFRPIQNSSILNKYSITNERIVLCVARIVADKGIQNAVRAMPLILKEIPKTKLMIVGGGSYMPTIRRLVRKYDLEEHVIFTGFAEFSELPYYFSACDVFVNPTIRQNGYDLTILEAMACGKPVVVSNLGSVPTVIEHNIDGILVPPKDINTLSKKIVEVLKDKKLASRLGNAARKKVVKKFSLDKMVENTLTVYEDVIRKHKRGNQ
jgi:glycosyltransferase involved in cell wall biosynthesis